jgi:hypothetical protein
MRDRLSFLEDVILWKAFVNSGISASSLLLLLTLADKKTEHDESTDTLLFSDPWRKQNS